jgi:hypothetical protein
MAEDGLVLFTLPRKEFDHLNRSIGRGEMTAEAAFGHYWDTYAEGSVVCFLCDFAITACKPYPMLLPDYKNSQSLMIAPLCATCWSLPKMVRLSKCFRLLKKMSGKRIGFHFAPTRR